VNTVMRMTIKVDAKWANGNDTNKEMVLCLTLKSGDFDVGDADPLVGDSMAAMTKRRGTPGRRAPPHGSTSSRVHRCVSLSFAGRPPHR